MRAGFFLAYSLLLAIARSLYIMSFQVETNQCTVAVYPSTSLTNPTSQQKISTLVFQKSFRRIPQVLLGISYLDLGSIQVPHFNYKAVITSISKTQFVTTVSKEGNSSIFALKFIYIAIDSDDAYIKQGEINFSTSIYYSSATELRAKVEIPYSRTNIDTTRWVRKIVAFFTGYSKILPSTFPTDGYFSASTEINYLANSFEIIFISLDSNLTYTIDAIYYNYIEYYQDTVLDYFRMDVIFERNYLVIPPTSGIYTGSGLTITENVSVDRKQAIFYGVHSLSVPLGAKAVRFRLANPTYVAGASPTFSINYQTWSNTIINSASADFLVFTQFNCGSLVASTYSDFQKLCVVECPAEHFYQYTSTDYLERTRSECLFCDQSCKTCFGEAANNCNSCVNQTYYLYQNSCYPTQPNDTYCGGSVNQCTLCQRTISGTIAPMCLYCESDLQNCIKCANSTYYLYKGTCYERQPLKTYCDSNRNCFDCYGLCQSCTSSNNGSCTSCVNKTENIDGYCLCENEQQVFDEEENLCIFSYDPFSKGQGTTIGEVLKGLSTGSQASALILGLTSGFISQSTSIMTQELTIQKIFYLQLTNANIPYFLYKFLDSIVNKGIIPEYQSTDFISLLAKDNEIDTIGYKYKQVGLPASIVQNSSGALVLSAVIGFGQFILSLFTKTQLKKLTLKLFKSYLANYIVAFVQLMVLVYSFSLAIQVAAITMPEYGSLTILKCFIMAPCFLFPIIILLFEYNTISKTVYWLGTDHESIMGILEENISFNCIKDRMRTHSYIIPFTIIECIFYPLISVLSRSNYIPAVICFICLSIFEFLFTLRLKPFYSKIDNIAFCLDQLLWIIVFILFSILTFLIDGRERIDRTYTLEMVGLSLAIMILLLVIILTTPFFQIANIVLFFKKKISSYLLKRKVFQSKEKIKTKEPKEICMTNQKISFDKKTDQFDQRFLEKNEDSI